MDIPMRLKLIELLAAAGLTIAALLAFAKGGAAADIQIVNATAAKSLTMQAKTGAVYLTLKNAETTPDRLIALSTPAADMAMIHRSVNENDVMKMEHLDTLELPAGASLDFAAEGYHVMLVGLKQPLKIGNKVPLTLIFEKAGERMIEAEVK
jgi:periplasmic copper chaperone A